MGKLTPGTCWCGHDNKTKHRRKIRGTKTNHSVPKLLLSLTSSDPWQTRGCSQSSTINLHLFYQLIQHILKYIKYIFFCGTLNSSPGIKALSLPYIFPTALTKHVLLYIKLEKFIKTYTDFHSNETGLALWALVYNSCSQSCNYRKDPPFKRK